MTELKLKKGLFDLMIEVLSSGQCTMCGACSGICPYLRVYKEKVAVIDQCNQAQGQCYEICPRTGTDYDDLNKMVFGVGREDPILGTHRKIVFGRSADAAVRDNAQYGGTVTALMQYILASKKADAALLAGRSKKFPLLPEPIIATTPDQVLNASGSKYTACPTLSILDKALKEHKSVAVVGRACQVTALRKKQSVYPESKRATPVIGLFCMWALNYGALEKYLGAQIDLSSVEKYDIPEGDFVVYTKTETRRFPFAEIKDRRRESCDLCYDFTSELSDISVGSTELENDWNTVIIRSELGEKIWNAALGAGVVEEKTYPADRLPLLRKAAKGKKQRVLEALEKKYGAGGSKYGYLVLTEKEAGGCK